MVLLTDIDLTGVDFAGIPIFCGNFDGNGHMKRHFPTVIVYVARDKELLIRDIIEQDYSIMP